ncbi:MAG: hypothetical protein CSA89_00510 [Bacteroidales bacterium]|nr:MAG: hypothetical protein CSA89_00510 [Bacteroidales bacterium]
MDYNTLDKNLQLHTTIAMPIGQSQVTVFDVFDSIKDNLYGSDKEKNYVFLTFTDTNTIEMMNSGTNKIVIPEREQILNLTQIIGDEVIRKNKLYFYNPIVTMTFKNPLTALLNFNISSVYATNGTDVVYANFNGTPTTTIPLIPSPQNGQFGDTEFTFDRTNGGTHLLFRLQEPKELGIKYSVEVAPNEDISDEVFPQTATLITTVKLPFHFDAKSELRSIDTIRDVNLDLATQEGGIEFEELNLELKFHNHLPVQTNATIRFIDMLGNEICRKENISVDSPEVDANGFAQEPFITDILIKFNSSETKEIKNTKNIIIEYAITGKTEDSQINIKGTDWVKLFISAYIKGTVNQNIDDIINK